MLLRPRKQRVGVMDVLGMGKDLEPLHTMWTTFLWVWNYREINISYSKNMDSRCLE